MESKQPRKINPIQLQKYLKGIKYPASRDEVQKQAQGNRASDEIKDVLNRIPDQRFKSPAEISRVIGHIQKMS